MRGKGGPAGTPIGRSLDVPAGIVYDEVREAIATIDRVHGDGKLPPIPVRLVHGLPILGRFRFDPATGEPIGITVRADQRYRHLTALHEIGHFLDWQVFGSGQGFGSATNSTMDAWLEPIVRSRAYRQLDAIAKRGVGLVDGAQVVALTEREIAAAADALLPDECWARSYAQYVAIRSASPSLSSELDAFRTPQSGRVYYPLQWINDDFIPIAREIDNLFHTLGWRR